MYDFLLCCYSYGLLIYLYLLGIYMDGSIYRFEDNDAFIHQSVEETITCGTL